MNLVYSLSHLLLEMLGFLTLLAFLVAQTKWGTDWASRVTLRSKEKTAKPVKPSCTGCQSSPPPVRSRRSARESHRQLSILSDCSYSKGDLRELDSVNWGVLCR